MSSLKDKIQFLFLGLMMGLLIGGGFFILKLDDYFKALKFYKNLSQVSYETQKDKQLTEDSEKSLPKKSKTQKREKSDKAVSDSLAIADIDKTPDKNKFVINKDSLLIDSISLMNPENNEDIIVKKDELLMVKNIDVIYVNQAISSGKNAKDSLLHQTSGIRDDNNVKFSYSMEFWKSPINYKGYKMSKNKIVLYGMNPGEILKLYKFNDNIFLKTSVYVYRLDYSGDFKQLEKLSDESLLAKFKL